MTVAAFFSGLSQHCGVPQGSIPGPLSVSSDMFVLWDPIVRGDLQRLRISFQNEPNVLKVDKKDDDDDAPSTRQHLKHCYASPSLSVTLDSNFAVGLSKLYFYIL